MNIYQKTFDFYTNKCYSMFADLNLVLPWAKFYLKVKMIHLDMCKERS